MKLFSTGGSENPGFSGNEEEFNDKNVDIINVLLYIHDYFDTTEWKKIDDEMIMEFIEKIREELETMESSYNEPAPRGGEAAQEILIDIIRILNNSIGEFTSYVDDGKEERVPAGLSFLKEANSKIDFLRTNVAQQRMEIADILSRLKSAECEDSLYVEEDEKIISL
jgi:hypothetical protein